MNFTLNEEGDFFYESASPFEFFDILNSKKQEIHQVFGTLILPEEKQDSYPLVICMHGSMGWGISSQDHSINFLKNGFAIFKVHSFESRNVKSIYQDQMQVTVAMSLTDCYEALKHLSVHPKIDENNIFIAGWSFGGSTAVYAAWEPIAEKLAPNGERFKGYLAFYPGAYVWPEEMRWDINPILSLIGRDDDYTPSTLIENLSNAINKAGGNSAVILYENSHHSFDRVDPVKFLPDAIALSDKPSIIDKHGNLFFENDSGERFEMNTPEERLKLIESGSVNIGASLGRNWAARNASFKDSIIFLKKNLS
jgi:dienelactone hydrolase